MDNLTHSLVGALIGQTGLKRKTGLAMPALIIGANLPDVDAACFFWLEGTEHLAFRRGITHGPPALVLLPLVLAGLLAFGRGWLPVIQSGLERALKGWGLLIWQPIYLGVIAAHEARGVPDLSRLSVPWREDGFLAGYHISRHALRHLVLDVVVEIADRGHRPLPTCATAPFIARRASKKRRILTVLGRIDKGRRSLHA